jgi:4,5-dihydroxyphthalate decarboxylase
VAAVDSGITTAAVPPLPRPAPPFVLRTLLGDYPVTHALRSGEVTVPDIAIDFADVARPSSAFKRVVRGLEFDCAELAIVTYLIARACHKPLVLLPVVVMARFQHPFIVYDGARGVLAPRDLSHKRIGIRSYSVTTVVWLRGILEEHGVDPETVTWVTFEEPHVAEFVDPPTVVRAPLGKTPVAMLLAGEIDAAILGEPSDHPRLKPLFADADAEGRAWQQRHRALQINHMVVVRRSLADARPDIVADIYALLSRSKQAAGLPAEGALDTAPFGWIANRRNLEVIIDYVYRQRLIPRRFAVDELIDDSTRSMC